MTSQIIPILMPKWGLSMKEGILSAWHVEEGQIITPGQEIMDVETEKIANAVEAADGGKLRRRVGRVGETYVVKSLLGVMAENDVSEADIDAFIAAFETPVDEEEDTAGADTEQRVETASGMLRYHIGGSGDPAILLIHGYGGDRHNWQMNTGALAALGTVYALDLPGHGESTKDITMASNAEALTDAVQGFMDALDISSAHLVGHSMGGLIAARLAVRAPERAHSLTLIDAAGLGDEIDETYIRGFVSAASRRELKAVLPSLFADAALVSRSMVDDLLKFKRIDGVSAVLMALAEALFKDGRQRIIVRDALARLDVPIQVIWGEADSIIPASHAHAVPGARVEIISGVGHMPQIEAPDRVNEVIRGFIAS